MISLTIGYKIIYNWLYSIIIINYMLGYNSQIIWLYKNTGMHECLFQYQTTDFNTVPAHTFKFIHSYMGGVIFLTAKYIHIKTHNNLIFWG